jgi:type II secretory pathway component GspD/PulD (secretin)
MTLRLHASVLLFTSPPLNLAVSGVILACIALAGLARAQDVQLPDTLKLSRLVDLSAEISGHPLSYNPADLDITVTLRVPGGLMRSQVPDLLAHVLATRGLTTVRPPGSPMLSVVRMDQAAGLATSGDAAKAVFITELITPRHQTAKSLADSVRGLLSKPGGSVGVLGDSNVLIISDLAARIEETKLLLLRLDTPDTTIVKEVPLVFVSGTQAAATLAQISGKREAAGGRKVVGDVVVTSDGAGLLLICPPEAEPIWLELIATIDRREPTETRTYTPRFFAAKDVAKLVEATSAGSGPGGADDRFRLIVDDLTGGLIVSATASQHERINTLIERLDSAQGGPSPMRSFPIRNRPVNEMMTTLSRLIDAGVLESSGVDAARESVRSAGEQRSHRDLGAGATPPGASPSGSLLPDTGVATTPAARTSVGDSRPSLRLTADEATNTLIAVGEPRQLAQLESLLKSLDTRQPQVMLEAVLVSMTDTDALNLGIELEKLGNIGDAAYKIASLFGLSTSANGVRSVADSAGFTGAVLNPGDFSVVIRALQALNKGRSLSNPKVLVANNEQARFSSVLQQPFVRTDTTSSTATSSFGGSDSAGTTISVRPQIAQGDHLVLTYNINLSSFVGTPAAAGLPPPKQHNSVDSVATIPDGHVVVVGGLELESESTSTSQIPILGDVPLVGELFKSRSIGKSRTRFFVFIRATVLRHNNFEDLRFITARDAASARIPDGWPEVEPRIIR